MNIFKRLLKIGQAEIHALVDKMEDPIVLITQGITDMREELTRTEENYIRTRAVSIRTENTIQAKKEESDLLEEKAKQALMMSKRNEISSKIAEELAFDALNTKKTLLDECSELNIQLTENGKQLEEINTYLDVLKFNISKWEKELTTLRTKRQINIASTLANSHMAKIDSNSTINLLERMKAKIADEEALVKARSEFVKDKLKHNLSLGLEANDSIKSKLEELKKQLGIE